MSVAFVICTERHLENKSLLLVRSLRRFGGTLGAASPVFSYSPRPDAIPSDGLLRNLAALDVRLVFDVHNSRWSDYPFANKVVACAHAERNLPADTIIFLDTDQIVLREPSALELLPCVDAALRPVDRKYIGLGHDDDANYPYWMTLYELSGSLPTRKVKTTLDQDVIWEYYNSGLIAVRRSAGILSHWERLLGQILESGVLPTTGVAYVEQSAFAASVTAKAKEVTVLPPEYNFPVTPEWRETLVGYPDVVTNAKTLHYHRSFDEGRWREWLSSRDRLPLPPEQHAWLRDNLAELGI